MTQGDQQAQRVAAGRVIAQHSKSFALASRLLPRAVARDVVVLYAYCRRADDTIDLAPPHEHVQRLAALHVELDELFGARTPRDPGLATLRQVVRTRAIPRGYFEDLLGGLAMDAQRCAYPDFETLTLYAYRVAGVVGLMMCHVMGVRSERALDHAVHLGIGMQLTNIARDVYEDWQRGRLYLPDAWLQAHGLPGLRDALGSPFRREWVPPVAATTGDLLDRAQAYYQSGHAGIGDLSLRCGLAVCTAALVYAAIGERVRANACDPLAGRAVVPTAHKLRLIVRALSDTLGGAPVALLRPQARIPLQPWAAGNVTQQHARMTWRSSTP